MAHEAAYLSAMVDTTAKFLDALEKLPIGGDEAGNVAKHHPKYPRGQMYTRMFEAAEAMLATYRPMVLPSESTWETGNTWPLTALRTVNAILNETYGITFLYGKNPESGERETHLHFASRMLHDRRMAGIVHPSIPETLKPFPEVDPRHIALVRTAIEEMRATIAEFRTKEAALAETDRIRAEVEAIDAERTRLLFLLREMSSPIFWSIYAERWEEFDRHRTEASESRRSASRMRERGEAAPEAEWRRFAEIDERNAEQLHGIIIEQHAKPFVEASNLLEKIAPQVLHKLPIGNLDVLKSQNPVEAAERVREALSFVLAMGREPVFSVVTDVNRSGGSRESRVKSEVLTDRGMESTLVESKSLPSVNVRMIEAIQQDPSRNYWSAGQFATLLGCSKSTVHDTRTWEALKVVKAQAKIERMSKGAKGDRRRKTPNKRPNDSA